MPIEQRLFEARYGDGHWDSKETTLVSNIDYFSVPSPSLTRPCDCRVIGLYEFIELYWPESDFVEICLQSNLYVVQECFNRLGVLNGRDRWLELTVVELRAWFGICIFIGFKSNLRLGHFGLIGLSMAVQSLNTL